ncbi:MAG: hypothetical protein NXI31_18710 [bacterium]|nr:hypothetical protein [bacterium]
MVELTELDTALQQVAADRRRRDRLRAEADAATKQLGDARQAVRRWDEQVEASHEDLRALEGLGITGLLARLVGDRDEKLAAERAELVRHKLQRDEARAAIESIEVERDRLRAELEALAEVDDVYAELLTAKEALLRTRGGRSADQLVQSAESLGELSDELREVEEAAAAGREAVGELDAALEDLGSARSWGTFDMLGGGVFVTMAKHGGIDRAQSHIERAQVHLRRFVRELEDVDVDGTGLEVDVGDFLRMADYFFDGLLVDWMVQSRIVNSIERAEETRRSVRRIVLRLDQRTLDLESRLATARKERRAWLEQAE